jgi:hypothetical protein
MVGFSSYIHGLDIRKWQRVKPISGWEILDADLFNLTAGVGQIGA